MTERYDDIRARYTAKAYPWWTGPYNLNLFGIRRAVRPNAFDDTIGVAYEDERGNRCVETFEGTTDPGTYYLLNPMRVEGTAVIALGYHRSIWQPGSHRGQYPALVQVTACTVLRDRNRNALVDPDPSSKVTGLFGINLHRANVSGTSTSVDRWSAGCQVLKDPGALSRVLALVERQRAAGYGSKVSYALFDR